MDKRILYLASVIFVVIWLIPHQVPNYDGDTDFPWAFVPAAKGEIVDAYRGFLYPFTLKIFHYLWGDWMMAGRMISSLAMSLSLLAIFQIAGWPAVILLLISTMFWWLGYHLTTDALFWFWFVGAYWAIQKRSYYWFYRYNIWLYVSGLFAGLAFCTKYLGIILITLGYFATWRNGIKAWRFFITALPLIGFNIFLNMKNGIGPLGDNFRMNVMEKGTALSVPKIVGNLINFPIQMMAEFWPLFGILAVLAMAELVKRRRWELLIMSGMLLVIVSITFYSTRFLFPLMLPIVIGGSYFIRRLEGLRCQ